MQRYFVYYMASNKLGTEWREENHVIVAPRFDLAAILAALLSDAQLKGFFAADTVVIRQLVLLPNED